MQEILVHGAREGCLTQTAGLVILCGVQSAGCSRSGTNAMFGVPTIWRLQYNVGVETSFLLF